MLFGGAKLADLVLFDPDAIEDGATFMEPELPAKGIKRVFLGGREVVGPTRCRHALMPARPALAQSGPPRPRPRPGGLPGARIRTSLLGRSIRSTWFEGGLR